MTQVYWIRPSLAHCTYVQLGTCLGSVYAGAPSFRQLMHLRVCVVLRPRSPRSSPTTNPWWRRRISVRSSSPIEGRGGGQQRGGGGQSEQAKARWRPSGKPRGGEDSCVALRSRQDGNGVQGGVREFFINKCVGGRV
jgi:hypothetical protein